MLPWKWNEVWVSFWSRWINSVHLTSTVFICFKFKEGSIKKKNWKMFSVISKGQTMMLGSHGESQLKPHFLWLVGWHTKDINITVYDLQKVHCFLHLRPKTVGAFSIQDSCTVIQVQRKQMYKHASVRASCLCLTKGYLRAFFFFLLFIGLCILTSLLKLLEHSWCLCGLGGN